MKRFFFSLLIAAAAVTAMAQQFDEWFVDSTLRLDYVFAGNNRDQRKRRRRKVKHFYKSGHLV